MKYRLKNLILVFIFCAQWANIDAQTTEEIQNINLDSVLVVGTAPLPGSDIPISRLPSITYGIHSQKLKDAPGQFSMDYINRHIGAVHLYMASGNDRQASVNYRGFQAAPLLGLSQGVTVYLDGIRMNDQFGDVMHWEMMPSNGLKRIELTAGSNPIFGLNTLGGSLQYLTKSGFDLGKNNVSIQGGSYGYKSLDTEIGFQKGKWGFMMSGNLYDEDGWRDFSPSTSGRGLAKISRKHNKGISHLSFHYAKSSFLGNGAIPVELLDQNRNAVFTHPDKTDNRLAILALHHTWNLSKNKRIQALVYYKNRDTQTFNGDDSSYEPCEGENEGFMCTEEEEEEEGEAELVVDQFGEFIPVSESVLSAVNNRTSTSQNNLSLSLQYHSKGALNGLPNRFQMGQRLEVGSSKYMASTELASLTETRSTIGSGLFDNDQFTEVEVDVLHWRAFASNWIDLFDHKLTLQTAAIVNYSSVTLDDKIGVELNGDHEYFRVSPSIGAVWHVQDKSQLYVNYSISNRTPTPVELTCADPDDPCRLPNSFLADPPLEQVVSANLETGWRGVYPFGRVMLAGYYTRVKNDIYFVSAGPARNSGYFRNLASTSRRGIEFEYTIDRKSWDGSFSYNYIKASFDEEFVVSSPLHPNASEGETVVEEGNSFPLIPANILKINAGYKVKNKFRLGVSWNYYSQQHIRGDESNTLDYRLPAFHFVHLNAKYNINQNWSFFGEVKNLFDQKYSSFGLLGEPDEIEEFEDFEDPIFLSPSAPRLIRLGVKYSW